jgi:hypothetical protein
MMPGQLAQIKEWRQRYSLFGAEERPGLKISTPGQKFSLEGMAELSCMDWQKSELKITRSLSNLT